MLDGNTPFPLISALLLTILAVLTCGNVQLVFFFLNERILLSELTISLILIQTEGASFDLSDKELFCIEEQEVFDAIYSIVRDFNCLPPALKFNIVETLRSNLSVLLPSIDSLSRASMSSPSDATEITDRIASHRNALKIYSFFLISIVLTAEAGAESCTAAKVIFVQKIQLFRLFMLLFF